jgi:excisionase family DNA binding protein
MNDYMKILERKIVENNATQIEQFLMEKDLVLTKATSSMIDTNKMYSTEEVCERLKIERHQVYKLIASGELKAKRMKSWKIPHASLEAYIQGIMTE